MSPSATFSFSSPPSVFSPLALISLTLSMMLPGMPEAGAPVTPSAFLLPCASVSTVFAQSGWGSAASSDDAKSVLPACADNGAALGRGSGAADAVAGIAKLTATAAAHAVIHGTRRL